MTVHAGAAPPPTRDLAADHRLLLTAVREAGALALSYFGRARNWEKRPGEPVSEADLAVDTLLRQRLQGERPDYGWLSEETEDDDSRLGCRSVWIVDPIDGTRAFIQGRAEFTVCAALVGDGQVMAAAVYNPATEEFYEALLGHGARLNGQPVAISRRRGLAGARLLASERTFKKRRWLDLTPGATFAYKNSIAYRMVKVAGGEYDAAISLSAKSDWDIAAADLILQEAGGRCTTIDGSRFTYNQPQARHPSVLSAAPGVYDDLRRLLASP